MRWAPLFALAVVVSGCHMPWRDEHEKESFGLSEDDPDAPPSTHEIRARVINDARTWRMLRENVEQGRADCPQVKITPEGAVCAADNEKFEVVHFPGDAPDKPYRVEETAFYCAKESVYYYHYVGGRDRLDVWMGPYKVSWNRNK